MVVDLCFTPTVEGPGHHPFHPSFGAHESVEPTNLVVGNATIDTFVGLLWVWNMN